MAHRIKAAVASSALVLSSLAATVVIAEPAHAARHFANCTALTKVYDHGVARSKKAALKQVRQGYGKPAHGKRARAVYHENKANLDRDKDGTACER